jgi:hypothetical protein
MQFIDEEPELSGAAHSEEDIMSSGSSMGDFIDDQIPTSSQEVMPLMMPPLSSPARSTRSLTFEIHGFSPDIKRKDLENYATRPLFTGLIDVSCLTVDPTNRRLFKFHVNRLSDKFQTQLDFNSHPPIIVSIPESSFDDWYPLCVSLKPFPGDIVVP